MATGVGDGVGGHSLKSLHRCGIGHTFSLSLNLGVSTVRGEDLMAVGDYSRNTSQTAECPAELSDSRKGAINTKQKGR